MSARVFTPTNQKLLTNVAVVRQKKGGKRFEIACFKNKVMSWRSKVEKDIDEVLQIHTVFTNVSKGQVAKTQDLVKAYGTEDIEEIILQILAKGQLQVSKEERDAQLQGKFKEIASIVSTKCINPENGKPYTVAQIERAMKDIHFSVRPTQSAKSQALDVIRKLSEEIPLQRAQMTIRIVLPKRDAKKSREAVLGLIENVEEESWDDDLEMVCVIDPGNYRDIDDKTNAMTKGRGMIEILSVNNTTGEDETL